MANVILCLTVGKNVNKCHYTWHCKVTSTSIDYWNSPTTNNQHQNGSESNHPSTWYSSRRPELKLGITFRWSWSWCAVCWYSTASVCHRRTGAGRSMYRTLVDTALPPCVHQFVRCADSGRTTEARLLQAVHKGERIIKRPQQLSLHGHLWCIHVRVTKLRWRRWWWLWRRWWLWWWWCRQRRRQ